MRKFAALLLLVAPLAQAANYAGYGMSSYQSPSSCGSSGQVLQTNGNCQLTWAEAGSLTPTYSSATVTTELNIPNGGNINIYGTTGTYGKLNWIGAATITASNSVGDSVLSWSGASFTGFLLTPSNSEIRFGSSGQVVLKKTGTAEMTVFTDNGTGGGYLLTGRPVRTKAQLDTITPAVLGQEYWCSDCAATSKVVTSTGTAIAGFAVLNTSTKPN